MDLKNAGFAYRPALLVQMLLDIGVAYAFFTCQFKRLDAAEQMLIVSAATLLMTPYVMPYDTLFFTCSLFLVAAKRSQITLPFGILITACYYFPALFWGASTIGVPGISLLPLLVMLVIFRSKKRDVEIPA